VKGFAVMRLNNGLRLKTVEETAIKFFDQITRFRISCFRELQ